MNPVFWLALFALYPLARAAKEDWKDGMVMNIYFILILLGAGASWFFFPEFMQSEMNIAGLVIWFIVLALAWYSESKNKPKEPSKEEKKNKNLGLADIYLGLALTLLLGMWSNFLFMGMSVALIVYLLVRIFKKPEMLLTIFTTKTRLVPFYLLGLIGLIVYSFFA